MSGCRISKVKFKDSSRELTILPPPLEGRGAAMRGVLDAFAFHDGVVTGMGIVLMDDRNQVTRHYVLNKNDATPLIGGLRILEADMIEHERGLLDE